MSQQIKDEKVNVPEIKITFRETINSHFLGIQTWDSAPVVNQLILTLVPEDQEKK